MKKAIKQPSTVCLPKAYGGVGLGLSIFGMLLFTMPYFGLPLSILALVFGSKHKGYHGCNGLSTSAYVCGIIGIIINSIMLLILLFVLLLSYSLSSLV